MRTLRGALSTLSILAFLSTAQPVWAQSPTNEELKRELDRKDQQIRQLMERLERLEKQVGIKTEAPPSVATPPAPERAAAAETPADEKKGKPLFRIFGTLDSEVRWRDNRTIGDREAGSSSNLYVRRAVVGAEVTPADFVAGTLVLQSEYAGTSRTNQDGTTDADLKVDKATISLGRDDIPVYGVFGWRVQPFGAFYNHLITDPMTQDAYEVKRAGATVGSKLPLLGLDVSATVYQGETQIGKIFEANLFDTGVVTRTTSARLRDERDGLRSFNVTAAVAPLPEVTGGLGYLSEPGDSRRNQTGAVWGAVGLGDLTVEGEFMLALARERFWNATTGALLADSAEERTLALGLAYKLLPQLTVAGRYEHFWDDGLGSKTGIWSTERRFSIGGTYTLLKRDGFTVQGLVEYRGTDLERPQGSLAADWRNELFGRLSISYE